MAASVVSENFSKKENFVTTFQKRVYEICEKIPRGKVATYGQIAQALDSSPRAVGQALKKNPFAPDVPCHRVVGAQLNIGGYSPPGIYDADSAVKLKVELLKSEGVEFLGNKIKSKGFLVNDNSSLIFCNFI